MTRVPIIEIPQKTGRPVKLAGWVHSRRDHGQIIFIDLRDRSGLAQLVFIPKNKKIYELANSLRPEWVIGLEGKVNQRPKGMENPKIPTGKVEVAVQKLEVFNKAETPPFEITEEKEINEETRLKYRYLDLRRERMKNNLILRHKVVKFIRDFLSQKGFIEIETPILTKSTPEGARDYIVPSRLCPSKFYALPQSPQQYKQLLMVAGIEKYFQIARCFRDEDTRGDRQPEFTQLDLEMSFMEQKDILNLTEELFIKITEETAGKKVLEKPFPRITYKEAMDKFSDDKFDLRKDKNPSTLAFAWVIDFPLFIKTETKELTSSHHPFTAPKDEDIDLLNSDKQKDWLKIRSWQYDLVCNGYEVGGGSIRITNPKIQSRIFEILGYAKEEIDKKFRHLLTAFKYGVPPHGGIAPGIDRLMMILQNEPNIREVMAFPKTGDGQDLMMNSPNEVSSEQLKELHLKILK